MDSISAVAENLSDGFSIHHAELPSKGEDRTVILPFQQGTIIAIFDGHCGSQLSDYSAETLPLLLSERLRDGVDVAAVMRDTMEEFDASLLEPVLALFDKDEDWSNEVWLETEKEVCPRIGSSSKDERYQAGLRATIGSTVLLAFLDQHRRNLWVASLGDCDAVCGRRNADGKRAPIFLNDRHNCENADEVERILRNHPNENYAIQDGALLGTLRVTRALGDHQLKAPLHLATRILPHFTPARLEAEEISGFSNWTPPYMLSTPTVRHHEVLPGDIFLLASDGLRDILLGVPDARKFDVLLALASGEHEHVTAALGHQCIPAADGDNIAKRVIENALFGADHRKKARELRKTAQRDDISLVVVEIK
ncbi:phosphatase 2C-like domain-containing protein [Mycena metata]|uniref:Phosphatase 2C-like domain-containing protein n=1 Tax=Mycena metata TaxID=1033252 RepID=A0AAD7HL75_9AGAR|nr:phosphatase 2C-like domain-containing protein [Mycena metata]